MNLSLEHTAKNAWALPTRLKLNPWQISAKECWGGLLATLLYYVLARLGMAIFALHPSNITLLWLPSGVALVMCLHWGYRALPLIVLASFAANFSGMHAASNAAALGHTVLAALIDGLAGVLAMRLFTRFLPDGLHRAHDLWPWVGWVCLGATTCTSVLLSLNLAWGGYIAWAEAPSLTRTLILADGLGMVLIYPLYQGWRERRLGLGPKQTLAWPWLLAMMAGLAALLSLGLSVQPGLLFFVVPLLLWLSFRCDLLTVASLSALSLVIIIAGTAQHLGPFISPQASESNFRLLAFGFASALTTLGLALQNRQLRLSEHASEQWKDAAEHDALTGLLNRRVFVPSVAMEHLRSQRTGKIYTVAMLDLDHFKQINDTHGHGRGDAVLRACAALMQRNCRAIDTVARWGGEEFAILLPECTSHDAVQALDRLRHELASQPLETEDCAMAVTVSIGVASCVNPAETSAEVLARADRGLYAAKAAGRNCIVIGR